MEQINKEDLEKYKEALAKAKSLKEDFDTKRAAFEEQNKELTENIKAYYDLVSEYRDKIKEQAESEFKVTGNKKLIDGIGIRVGTELEYDDNEALKWATEHKLCLALDKTAFKKIAKDQNIDFVTKTEKVTVTFPAELK